MGKEAETAAMGIDIEEGAGWFHFEIWQGGICVASGSGPDLDETGREMVRYAAQYVQDGPITIKGSPELKPHGPIDR